MTEKDRIECIKKDLLKLLVEMFIDEVSINDMVHHFREDISKRGEHEVTYSLCVSFGLCEIEKEVVIRDYLLPKRDFIIEEELRQMRESIIQYIKDIVVLDNTERRTV